MQVFITIQVFCDVILCQLVTKLPLSVNRVSSIFSIFEHIQPEEGKITLF